MSFITELTPASVSSPTAEIISTVITPSGHFLYVAGYYYNNTIAIYHRDLVTGLLTFVDNSTVVGVAGPGDNGPYNLAMDPSGNYLYCIDAGGTGAGYVYSFSIDPATGLLTQIQKLSVTTGQTQTRIIVHPTANILYIATDNFPAQSLFGYTISSGILSYHTSIETNAAPSDLFGISFDNTGTWLYASSWASTAVYQFSVNQSTTALALLNTYTVGLEPWAIGFSPDNLYCYVTNYGDSTVSQFSVNQSTGALTPLSPATVSTAVGGGTGAYYIAFAQGGVFVQNVGGSPPNVLYFTPVAGGLTNPQVTGAPPVACLTFIVSPDGKFAYLGYTSPSDVSGADVYQCSISLAPPDFIVTYTDTHFDAINPQCILQYSDDGGITWSNERYCSLGSTGQYLNRVIFYQLGTARNRVYRVVDVGSSAGISGADLIVMPGVT